MGSFLIYIISVSFQKQAVGCHVHLQMRRALDNYLLPVSGKSKICIQTGLSDSKVHALVGYHLLHSP